MVLKIFLVVIGIVIGFIVKGILEKNKSFIEKLNNVSWGFIALIYLLLILFILGIGVYGLLTPNLGVSKGGIFVLEKMVESGLDALVVGFIGFAIQNAFSKYSKTPDKTNNVGD